MMKKIIVIPFAFFLYCSLYAQESTVKQTLTSIKNQIITNKYSPVDENSLYKEGNGFFVLNNLASWYADSTYAIRSRAVIITGRLGSFTESEEVRSLAIDKLFALCTDNNVSVVKNAAGYLKTIPWKSFNTGQKNSLKQFLKPGQPALEDFIYLTGYTYSKNYIDDLNALLISDKISNAEKWQIYASLARLGNETGISTCSQMAKDNPLDDNYLKTIVPGIIFTRQKSCTDVLVELLKTDEKNCIPANPNYSGAIPCRYRIVAALAKVVNDFPIKVKRSGDLITNDYEKSLQEAISWFNENPNYTFVE